MRTVKGWIHETAGGLPRTFWFIWANTLINRVGSFVIILLAIYLTQERHLSPTYAGFVIGLWGAGGAVGTLLGGVLADRWGRKKTFLTALYSGAAMMLLLGFARGAMEITLAVLALGVVSEAARPALSALMIDVVPAKDRLRAFSLNYWVINLGFAFAATTAGLVAGVNYTLLFAIDATTTVAAATLIAFTVREPVREPVRARPRALPGAARQRRPGLRTVFADRVFLAYVGVNVLTALVFMQHISTLPMTMARDGLSASTYGTVIALNGVLIVIGQLLVPRLLRGRSRATALAVAAVIMGIGFGLNAFAHTAWLYATAVAIWTLGEMLNAPSNSATNAELSPADLRGRYQGVFALSWSAASFLAPITGAAVLQYAGDTTLWLGCLAIGCLVAVIHVLAGPSRERRAAQLREPTPTAAPVVAEDSTFTPEPELIDAHG
jgi:MFS family permease